MPNLFGFLIVVGLGAIWFSLPVHAESFTDMNRLGTCYAAQSTSNHSSGPVVKPAGQRKSGVTDDSVIKRVTKKPSQ